MIFGPTDKIAIFGRSGCGKSTLQSAVTSCYPRLVVIDRMREHSTGDLITNNFEQYANFLSQAMSLNKESFKLVLQFNTEKQTEEQELIFEQAVRLAYKFGEVSGRGVCLSVEEVQFFAPPTYIPHWLKESTLTGRHAGMAVVVSSQRPAAVHKDLVSQASHVFVGQLFEMRDMEYLRHTIGDAAYQAKELGVGKFIHYSQGQTNLIDNGFRA